MSDFEKALEITESRLSFYDVRGNLLEGKDNVSVAYQKAISDGQTVIIGSGGGYDFINKISRAPEKMHEEAIHHSRRGNIEFSKQWTMVKDIILNLQKEWNKKRFQNFLEL